MVSLVGYDCDSDDSDHGELGAQEPSKELAQAGPPKCAEAEGSGAAEFGCSAKASVGHPDSRQLLSPEKSALSNASGQGEASSQRVVKPSLRTPPKPPIQQLPANQPSRVILPSAADLLGDSPDTLSFAVGTAGRGGPSGRLQGQGEIPIEGSRKRAEPNPNMLLPKPPSKVLKGGSGAGLAGGSGSIRGGIGRAGADGRGGGSGAAAGAANSFLPPQLRGRFGNMPGGVGAGSGGMTGYGGGLGGAAAPGGGGGGSGGFGPGGAGAGAPGGGAAGAGGPPGVGGVGSIPAGGAGAGSGFPAGAAPPGAQGMGGMGGKVGDAGRRERWVGWARWRRMGAHTTAEGKVGGLGAGLARAGGLGKVGEWGRGWKGAAMAEYYNAIANEVAQDGGTYHGGGQGGWAGQGGSPPGLPSLPSPCVSLSFAEDKGGRGERGYGGEGMGGHAHAHAAYGGGGGGGGGRGGEGGIGPAARESNIVKMRGLPFSATSKVRRHGGSGGRGARGG
ncbi:unnamed protein product [Closterium sp. NIES-53]